MFLGIEGITIGARARGGSMTGGELKAIREAMELTQVQFAELLGLKPQTVSDLERGRMVISDSVSRHAWAQYKLWHIREILDSS